MTISASTHSIQHGFSINAIGFVGSAVLAALLGSRFGTNFTIIGGVSAYTNFALLLLGLGIGGADHLCMLIGLLFCAFACLGVVIPTKAMLSLEDHGATSGIASALGGTLQMTIGAIAMAVADVMFDGSARPMIAFIALCAVGTLATASATLLRQRHAPVGQRALKIEADDISSM